MNIFWFDLFVAEWITCHGRGRKSNRLRQAEPTWGVISPSLKSPSSRTRGSWGPGTKIRLIITETSWCTIVPILPVSSSTAGSVWRQVEWWSYATEHRWQPTQTKRTQGRMKRERRRTIRFPSPTLSKRENTGSPSFAKKGTFLLRKSRREKGEGGRGQVQKGFPWKTLATDRTVERGGWRMEEKTKKKRQFAKMETTVRETREENRRLILASLALSLFFFLSMDFSQSPY